ncbi:MAG: M48 family metallopeptidase [Phycisphaerae bacterium]|nr:M48 family metallopeptidase [Phycisphaerae bacterium]
MNFYEHQDRAQRRTKVIVCLFILAVLCITAVVAIPIGFTTEWDPVATIAASVICLLVVGIATLFKLNQLRGGGSTVAEMMGGTLLQLGGSTQTEKRIQNIVEEMAIASGMPVPPVYILEDATINAFAAGWAPSDAVIGVTRGCIEKLNRDELQGVIAHEFSHISHGDMRINIRLIGIIFGIMVLGITGWILVRFVGPMILRTSSRSRSKEGAGGAGIGLAVILFGLFLAFCGFVGTFFGRLIQAAVSRQREFLADASAVQFTRNPSGIGGALRKIGGITPLATPTSDASQCNHMFFSQAMNSMFASHPPVKERIARVEGIDVSNIESNENVASPVVGDSLASGFSEGVVLNSIKNGGVVQKIAVAKSRSVLSGIGDVLLDAVREPWSARLVLFAIVVDLDQPKQDEILSKNLGKNEWSAYKKIVAHVSNASESTRLPIIDLAAPALKQLSKAQLDEFNTLLTLLIKSDGVIDRFEWVFVSVIQKHLAPPNLKNARAKLSLLSDSASLVLAMLAYYGTTERRGAELAYKSGAESCSLKQLKIPEISSCTIENLNGAIKKLQQLRFSDRERFLLACEMVVVHDEQITTTEAEVIRAIGDLLDCPIPMFG